MKESNLVISTGFTAFDKMTGGLRKGELVCIASQPGQGKTALAQNIVAHIVLDKRFPVLFFSLNLNRYSLMQRFIAAEAKVNLKDIHNGSFKHDRWQDLMAAAMRFADVPLYINDTPGMNIAADIKNLTHEVVDLMERNVHHKAESRADLGRLTASLRANDSPTMAVADIRATSHLLQSLLSKDGARGGKKLGLVVIDSVQQLRVIPRGDTRQGELSEIFYELNCLARELEIPVMVLAQLARASEEKTRTNNKPKLSDLRESSSLDHEADLVVLIHREDYYKRNDPTLENKAEIVVAMNPRGKTGSVKMKFEREYVKFSGLT